MATKRKPKEQTPLQVAVRAFQKVCSLEASLDQANKVLNRKVDALNTEEAKKYVEATTAYAAKRAEFAERVEKMREARDDTDTGDASDATEPNPHEHL